MAFVFNQVGLQARIPFDLEIKNGDDDKKAFLGFSVSVRRNYKKEDEKYYPEDLIYCKAFGKTAQFINQYYKKGDNVMIAGELHRSDDYEKEGVLQKGEMYVQINNITYQYGNAKDEGGNGGKSSSAKSDSKPAASSGKKSSFPTAGAKKKSIL